MLRRCDPLGEAASLHLKRIFFPLGFPLEVSTNSEVVLQAAEESWGADPECFGTPPLQLGVTVGASGRRAVPPPPVFRGQRHLFVMSADGGNFAVGDYTSYSAFCWLTLGALADRGYLRFHFLEALVYSMLAQTHLTMLHAACVSIGGSAALLAGKSGSGKSSLAFACAARGWDFVADDASALLWGDPSRTVLGRPFYIRFRPSAVELFPEMRDRIVRRHANGKPTIEVATRSLPGIKTAFKARADYLVFLNRSSSVTPGLIPVSKTDALERLFGGAASIRPRNKRATGGSLPGDPGCRHI